MIDDGGEDISRRVLILAPTAKDAVASEAILLRAGIASCICRGLAQLCDEARRGAGAIIITEEAVLSDREDRVASLLRDQPPWSDLPTIVLTAAGPDSPRSLAILGILGHTTLVNRPVNRSTLVSTVASALRDRLRQYQARDHIRDRERQTELLREARDTLAFALEAGRLGSWQLDLETGDIQCSAICKRNFGLPEDAKLTHAGLLDLIHPEDRGAVDRAIRESLERGTDYHVEYRNVWPDRSVHWVQVRGRATSASPGAPARMAGVSLDITARKEVEEALRMSVDRLEDADRRKDEFLAMLAHELRNPLSAISNAMQVAKRSRSADHLEWSQAVVERHARHLSRMIDDLLDVSRITRGAIELRREPLGLAPILRSAVETARPLIEEKRHELTVDLDVGRVKVRGDATRLEQVFVNLLINAAKYTDAGGRISLSAEGDDGHAVVRVGDTGVGMTPEFLARAFDLFAQGDRTAARSEGGLGIGLTLVKSLVELHGGAVVAASDGPGRGSEFAVRLPVDQTEAEEAARREPAGSDPGRGGSRVLIVDDNVDTAVGMVQLLEILGYEAAGVHDGPSAIAAAISRRPAFVLLDIGLPGMDGYQVARALRDRGFSDTVIIALSGYGQDEDRRRSQAAGFDHHLVKPVDVDSLVTLLGSAR